MKLKDSSQSGFVGIIVILISLAIVGYLVMKNVDSLHSVLGISPGTKSRLIEGAAGVGEIPDDAIQTPASTIEYFKQQKEDIEKKISK